MIRGTHFRGTDLARQIANAVFIPLGIVLNFVPASGRDVGKITRAHESLLSAAGFTFAIWSVIFFAQLVYAVWQCLPSQRTSPTLQRIGWLTALNGLLQGLWTVAFSQEAITLSWVMMLTILATQIIIERRIGRAPLLVRLTYGLNFGWIAVATMLDTSLFLHDVVGWNAMPLVSAQIFVGVAALVALYMAIVRRNLAFPIAVAWGFVGVGAYRFHDARVLAWLAFYLAALLGLLVVVEGLGLRFHWRPIERLVNAAR